MRLQGDKTLAQYLGLYLCRCLTVFISPRGPVSDRGLGLGQAEGPARGLMGSWYSAGRHSRSECVPGPMCHALVQPQAEKKETVPVSKGLRMVWRVGARATGDCDLRSPWHLMLGPS